MDVSSEPVGRHAFIIDDEIQVRAFITKILVNAGFVASQFSRLAEVEAALTLIKPEIIILDLSLVESDAVEIIRSLAASRYSGMVLLISGYHDPATLAEVHKIGKHHGLVMLPFLRKPFRVEELKARLSAVTDLTVDIAEGVSLEDALQNNWLELWYQPKIDLKSKLVCGAEALIRLRHPEHGLVSPAAFLPPPGDPLYQPLTDFVVRRSLADWPSFADNRITTRLAINVPASILEGPDFVANVRRHLPKHPKFPGLIVEITESEAISDLELTREIAIQLKLYNIDIAIDDFGTGHSSLARLKELPFAELKLDRSYVDGCSTDKNKRIMCQNVVLLAHKANITAVAEGVETAADLKTLIDMGYDVAQGFFFARPMQSKEFTKTLLSHAVEM